MTDPIQVMMNADGSFDLPAIHVVPYVAPVPVSPPPPPPVEIVSNVVASVEVKVDGQNVTFADKTVSARTLSSVTVGYGLGSSPVEIGAGGTVTKAYPKTGTFNAALTATDDNGVKSVVFFKVTVPGTSDDTYTAGQASAPPTAGGTASPPPVSPPPPATSNVVADVPSVVADGQSILYHYPMDTTLAAAVDHIEIPGTFGAGPETVAKIAWNFGDGTNGWGADGRHPYDKPGTYTITGSVNYQDGRIVPFGPLTVTVGA